MHQTKTLLAASIILSLTTLTAEASLTAGIAGGRNVVYDNVTNITWTGDANLLGTLETNLGYNTVVNAIIAASPTINDTPNSNDTPFNSGHHSVTSDEFSLNGLVSWFGAQAFTNYLNSTNYAGSNQWALPSAGANPQDGYNQTSSQFGELYYNELNALAYPGTNGSDFGILHNGRTSFLTSGGNAGPFANVQANVYWLGTEYAPTPYRAWNFYTNLGDQYYWHKDSLFYAWAVSPGNVAAVPVPAAVWLFSSGLIGLVSLKRLGKIG